MPFWIELPDEPDSYFNVDSAWSCRVKGRDEDGRISKITVYWGEEWDYHFDGFLARQVHARITANLMKAADEPKEGGRS